MSFARSLLLAVVVDAVVVRERRRDPRFIQAASVETPRVVLSGVILSGIAAAPAADSPTETTDIAMVSLSTDSGTLDSPTPVAITATISIPANTQAPSTPIADAPASTTNVPTSTTLVVSTTKACRQMLKVVDLINSCGMRYGGTYDKNHCDGNTAVPSFTPPACPPAQRAVSMGENVEDSAAAAHHWVRGLAADVRSGLV